MQQAIQCLAMVGCERDGLSIYMLLSLGLSCLGCCCSHSMHSPGSSKQAHRPLSAWPSSHHLFPGMQEHQQRRHHHRLHLPDHLFRPQLASCPASPASRCSPPHHLLSFSFSPAGSGKMCWTTRALSSTHIPPAQQCVSGCRHILLRFCCHSMEAKCRRCRSVAQIAILPFHSLPLLFVFARWRSAGENHGRGDERGRRAFGSV
jgi:hypothetical protein